MEYSSFYGGQQGASFILKKNYDSIQNMIADFASPSCEVNFGEYVLINTNNRINPDNGKIFRRGFDIHDGTRKIYYSVFTNNEWEEQEVDKHWGAEYCGKIVGPPGNSSHLELKNFTDVLNSAYTSTENKIISLGSYDIEDETAIRYIYLWYQDSDINNYQGARKATLAIQNNARVWSIPNDPVVYVPKNIQDFVKEIINNKKCNLDYIQDYILRGDFEDSYNKSLIPGKYEIVVQIYYCEKGSQSEDNRVAYLNIVNTDDSEDDEYLDMSSVRWHDAGETISGGVHTVYTEDAEYISVSFQDAENKNSIAYIGFKMPYHVFNFTSTSISAYEDPFISNLDTENQYTPTFSSNLLFGIPKGIKGDSLENLHIELVSFTPGEGSTLGYFTKYINEDDSQGTLINLYDPVSNTPKTTFDTTNLKQKFKVYIYSIRNYDDQNAGTTKDYYLGLFQQIKSINMSSGVLTIQKTAGIFSTYNLNYVANPVLSTGTEENPKYELSFEYANGTTSTPIDLDYVTDISLTTTAGTANGQIIATKASTTTFEIGDLTYVTNPVLSTSVTEGTSTSSAYLLKFQNNKGNFVEPAIDLDHVTNISLTTATGTENGQITAIKASGLTSPIGQLIYPTSIVKDNGANADVYGMKVLYNNSTFTTFTLPGLEKIETVVDNENRSFIETDFETGVYDTIQNIIKPQPSSEEQSIYKTPDDKLNTYIVEKLTNLINSSDSNKNDKIKAIVNLLNREATVSINNYVNYILNIKDNNNNISVLADGFNNIRSLTWTEDNDPELLILYTSIRTKIDQICSETSKTYTGQNNNYLYGSDYGWERTGVKLSRFVQNGININWDITDDFKAYADELVSIQPKPYIPKDVAEYLNKTYDDGKIILNNGTSTYNLATIQTGLNKFFVKESIESTAQIAVEEPTIAFYGFNNNTKVSTFTSTVDFNNVNNKTNVIDFIYNQQNYSPCLVASSDNNFISKSGEESPFTYTYLEYRGWYCLSNLFTGSRAASENGSGTPIYFSLTDQISVPSGAVVFKYTEE